MDRTSRIGRPAARDALRLLTIVHQLGERADGRWFVDTEPQLQGLDHLIQHPIDLAYFLLDLIRTARSPGDPHRPDLPGQVRQLLGPPSRQRRRAAVLRPFEPDSWERWDDVLAGLGCRDLLRVESLGRRDLRYRLTERGAAWLERSAYPEAQGLAPWRTRCELLRAVAPESLLQSRRGTALERRLRQVHQRLETYRLEEQVKLEDDLLGRVFQATFLEPL